MPPTPSAATGDTIAVSIVARHRIPLRVRINLASLSVRLMRAGRFVPIGTLHTRQVIHCLSDTLPQRFLICQLLRKTRHNPLLPTFVLSLQRLYGTLNPLKQLLQSPGVIGPYHRCDSAYTFVPSTACTARSTNSIATAVRTVRLNSSLILWRCLW